MKNVILTGDRPTGKLHLGHYVGSLKKRVELQNEGNYEKMIVLIADAQALTDNSGNPQKVRENIVEVMLDYLAVGLDPEKVIFAIQSGITALPELTAYYMNLVTLPRVLRNPTVKNEIKQRGFSDNEETGIPVGFVNYPISQAADITAFKANMIPVGDDQEPMLEQTREIVKSFNRIYKTDVLVSCKSILSENEVCTRLPGLDGNAKMSKSLNNCIYLADDEEAIIKKVNSIATYPRALQDPGIVEGNVLFDYLHAFVRDEHFAKFYPEFKSLNELEAAYRKGGLGDMKIKSFLNDVLQEEIGAIRKRREEAAKNIPYILEVLKKGTREANQIANQTLLEVKNAMGINYFNNSDFEKEQIEKYNN